MKGQQKVCTKRYKGKISFCCLDVVMVNNFTLLFPLAIFMPVFIFLSSGFISKMILKEQV